jgi:hypothetical protein
LRVRDSSSLESLPRTASGRSSARPVQIRFQRCIGSATALSLQRPSPCLSSRAKRADLRCAIRVPRSYRPTTPPIITESSWKPQPPLCHSGFQEWPAEPQIPRLRSPGFPVEIGGVGELHAPFLTRKAHTQPCPAQRAGNPGRDDKERSAVHKEWLLNRGIFQIKFGQLLSSAVPAGLSLPSSDLTQTLKP